MPICRPLTTCPVTQCSILLSYYNAQKVGHLSYCSGGFCIAWPQTPTPAFESLGLRYMRSPLPSTSPMGSLKGRGIQLPGNKIPAHRVGTFLVSVMDRYDMYRCSEYPTNIHILTNTGSNVKNMYFYKM